MDENFSNSMFHIFVDFIPEVTISSSDIGHIVVSISKLVKLNFSLSMPSVENDRDLPF